MPTNFDALAKKLQHAINANFNEKILLNRTQWYSEDESRPVTLFVIRKAVHDPVTGRNSSVELFSTYTKIYLVLWLRDYWYELNGWEKEEETNQGYLKALHDYKERNGNGGERKKEKKTTEEGA